MADARAQLRARLAREIAAPLPASAGALTDVIRTRHGEVVAAVVFYGSCRRQGTSDGVHDLFVVVDGYRAAYGSRALAAVNALLPPNVFYLELLRGGETLRAKYAVVSQPDLAVACSGRTRRSGIWARFAQPVTAAYVRDAAAREMLVEACVDAVCTALQAGLASWGTGWQRMESAVFWRQLFRATYAAELRPERESAIDALYAEDATHFDAVLEHALAVLLEQGVIERGSDPFECRVRLRGARLPRASLGKLLTALALAKSAFTFSDWLPYALWKVERHSGVRLEASERQRRHPLLFAWPLVLRALRTRALR